MAGKDLLVGCGSYDRMLALQSGEFDTADCRFIVRNMNVAQIPQAAYGTNELDVAEVSIGEYLVQLQEGDGAYTGLPVFPSIGFRHDCVYVAISGRVDAPTDLNGGRVGVTMHYSTTTIWVRDWLERQFGVDLESIEWVVGTLDHEVEKPPLVPKSPLRVSACSFGDSLLDMLERGDLDAIISYRVPHPKLGDTVRRLLPDSARASADYFRRYAAIPLLHMMVYRSSLRDADDQIAKTMYSAFLKSKDLALANLRETACYTTSLPSLGRHVEETMALIGQDFWPYGVERNRAALEIFLDSCARQGLTSRRYDINELFSDFV